MARFIQDQNRIALIFESGTYGTASGNGAWIGKVTSNSITENFNIAEQRFLGATGRGIAEFDTTAKDFEGTLTFYPQNMRFLGLALGSISFTSGASNAHGFTAVNNDQRQNAFTSGTLNPFVSFQLEDGKVTTNGSFVRTAQGCVVDTFNLSATQGEIVETEIAYRAQNVADTTNAPTSVTVIGSRPYMWKDITLQIPSGTTLEALKDITLTVSNNFEFPHYLNGSEVIGTPIPLNRDVVVSATADLQTEQLALYNNYWKSGTAFNALLDLNATGTVGVTGSLHTAITLSGCRFTSIEIPSENEGVQETTFEFKAGSILAVEWSQFGRLTPW